MPQRRLIALILIALIAVGVPVAGAQQANPTIKVGVIGAFDGPTARGVALALQLANSNGGVTLPDGKRYDLTTIVAPARTAAEVAQAVTALKNAGVVAIFGPDDDVLATQSLDAIEQAGVPVFLGATTRAVTPSSLIFRTQATDDIRFNALTDVLVNTANLKRIAVYLDSGDYSAPASDFIAALGDRGLEPVIILNAPPANLLASQLVQARPDGLFALGTPERMAALYNDLRGRGFLGAFISPASADQAFIEAIPPDRRAGVYGVTSWTVNFDTPQGSSFAATYNTLFGATPTGVSAAAYDGANVFLAALRQGGTGALALAAAVNGLLPIAGVQGEISPRFGAGLLSANVKVTRTGEFYGAESVVVAFAPPTSTPIATATPTLRPTATRRGERAPTETRTPTPTLTFTPSVTGTPPTATPTPTLTASFTPSATRTPTATPEGVEITVTAGRFVNVRRGPGTAYEILGRANRGAKFKAEGRNIDSTWFVITFDGQQAWITSDSKLVSVFGDVASLPEVQPPPLPTATPTRTPRPPTNTPTIVPRANIVFLNASLNPPIPQPGQPFTLTVTVQNQGTANATQFAVAASFKPGEVYAAGIVPSLAVGAQGTVALTATVNGTGVETIAIVLDLNQEVDEGPAGEADNQPLFTYRIDRPYIAQGTIQIAPGTSLDLYGGTQDLNYTGPNLLSINGALISILSGVQLSQVHYDLLAPGVVTGNNLPQPSLTPGTVIGFYTAEGQRGVLRVQSYNGPNIVLEYFIYQP